MTNYNYVLSLTEDLEIGEMKEVDVPDNIKLFRKNLTEISQRYKKKFTTKIRSGKLYVMRVEYYSVNEKISNPDF